MSQPPTRKPRPTAAGGLAGVAVAVEIGEPDPDGSVPTRLRLAVDGEDVVIDTEGTRQVVALSDITSGTVEPELGRAADAAAEG